MLVIICFVCLVLLDLLDLVLECWCMLVDFFCIIVFCGSFGVGWCVCGDGWGGLGGVIFDKGFVVFLNWNGRNLFLLFS